jgi:hypothetical protein
MVSLSFRSLHASEKVSNTWALSKHTQVYVGHNVFRLHEHFTERRMVGKVI